MIYIYSLKNLIVQIIIDVTKYDPLLVYLLFESSSTISSDYLSFDITKHDLSTVGTQ